MKTKKEVALGTIRVTPALQFFTKTKSSWKRIKPPTKEIKEQIKHVVTLFKAHNNLSALLDTKNSRFLKGQLSAEGQVQGARIPLLPNNQKLDKAFSLFAPHLQIHDQNSHDHWDVLYQNKGGTWSYVYTKEKKAQHRARKYAKVKEFAKAYEKLHKSVTNALRSEDDLAVPMYTLLKTYMRVGNEIYYKAHGHKGLTTLKKKDITIKAKQVTFSFLGKDGVPQKITQEFPRPYITKLTKLLAAKKQNEFVFTNNKNNHPLREQDFKKSFKKHCGKEFYPHIVRSHYATSTVQTFLKNKRSATKKEVESLFMDIAAHLGHKKFDKKAQQWKESYSVTINHYIQPELVEKVRKLVNNNR